ncbi:hypothetical protein H0H92_001199 [Tricholoma furcatifolium]|nr:hypothetical protein H0H92_001199 [Tricholoma furcatifolium]
MKLLHWFPLVLAAAAFAADSEASQEAPAELVIDTTFKPEECSVAAQNGDRIQVHYDPDSIRVGAGQVIKGWDQGLVGMCVGEKRTLTIPPELGYGARGAGARIPPHSTLVFETEMMAIDRPAHQEL